MIAVGVAVTVELAVLNAADKAAIKASGQTKRAFVAACRAGAR